MGDSTGTGGSTDDSKEDIVELRIFEIDIKKINQAQEGLSGATFQLYPDENGNAGDAEISLIAKENDTYLFPGDTTAPGTATKNTFTTPENGIIKIQGLEAGTYWLKETEAPSGYNKLDADVKITLTPKFDDTTGVLESCTVEYKCDGKPGSDTVQAGSGNSPTVTIMNKYTSSFPNTGGIGTVIFTVAGLGLLAAVTVSFMHSRKREDEA